MDGLELNDLKLTTCALELDNSIFTTLELNNSKFTNFDDSKANDKSWLPYYKWQKIGDYF